MATKRFKCPFCEKRLEREPLVRHIQNKHQELIPEGYSAARIVFNLINKKSVGMKHNGMKRLGDTISIVVTNVRKRCVNVL